MYAYASFLDLKLTEKTYDKLKKKMCCVKCQQHFCYRCGTKLSALDPYAHFSADGTGCYGKLFDIDQNLEEDGWQAIEWIDEL